MPNVVNFSVYADFGVPFWYNRSIKSRQVFLLMMTQNADKKRDQVQFLCMDDSRTFKGLYDKIKDIGIETLVADAGYKTPAIAKLLIDDGIKPLLPYKRPMTKDGFFKKYEYVYDEYYDCYIYPGNQVLTYRTTNRDGYREYKSCGTVCAQCPYLSQCTESRDHVKTVTRHIWEPYMEICEDIRQTLGMKDLYAKRKETIERLFGSAKENHGFRYTQMYGKARMEMKVGLTFACMFSLSGQ